MNVINLFKKTPIVFFSLSFMIGIQVGGIVQSFVFTLIVFGIGFSLLFSNKNQLFLSGLVICFLSFGVGRMQLIMLNQNFLNSLSDDLNGKDMDYEGIVFDIKQTRKGVKYKLRLYNLQDMDIWLYQKQLLNCSVGDTLRGTGEFQIFRRARNPGEFNFQAFFNRQNIYGWIFPKSNEKATVLNSNHLIVRRYIYQIQDTIRNHFQKYAPDESAGLLSALILGDKTDVEPLVKESFTKTGVIHVLAVSGLHVGYVLIVLLLLKNIFRLPWGVDRIVILLGLTLFVMITGGKASVIRASIMAGLYVMAPVFNRSVNVWNIISGAALAILSFRPLDLFDLGFQLSFLAVISIIFFYNWLQTILPEKFIVNKIDSKITRFVWGLLLVSFSAQIGTIPLTAYVFGKIPIISLVANVLIVPLIGILVGIGFLLLFIGWIPLFGFALGNSAWLISKIIIYFTTLFSQIPYSTLSIRFSFFDVLVYFLILVSIILLLKKSQRKIGLIIFLIVANLFTWKWARKSNELEVILLDVGQGDAAIVRFPNDKTMLIDGGERNQYHDMGKEVILPVLSYLGIKKIDWVVMTHPHNDHIGGLVTLFNAIPVDTLWNTIVSYQSWTYKTIMKNAEKSDTFIEIPVGGESKRVTPNIYLLFFAPDSQLYHQDENVNNASFVFKLVYGQTSILFTGDFEFEGDRVLIPYQKLLKSNLLKVAHHGSITSSTDSFLDLVDPELAFISVGVRNKFSHPSPIIIERLMKRNINIHRTDLDGALWLKSNGRAFRKVKWN